MAIINQMRVFGDNITDQTVVEKVLRSLTPHFDHVVEAIEESKNLTQLSIDELSGSLQAHEVRLNKSAEKSEEKAFQASNLKHHKKPVERGQGRGFYRAKSHGRESNAESNLFMANNGTEEGLDEAWLIDSGCSNHMTGKRDFFSELDESKRQKVKLGDDKEMIVNGEGTVAFTTSQGQVNLLHKVHYVPNLAYNLLSVSQLILSGYSVLFSNETCYIKDAEIGQLVTKVQMTANKMFPLDLSRMKC
ncbi:uncharacterized protein LOC120268441 [Dioscorea cayenensis subsp. rotundata]|uniref:Uncharacterized protein LOC120268441 n=1 Tax=Dioscorea cayennensis subsp. rotundata TaxID=55577 RepID=A0AB40BXE0_DIOCR|nr:uncharacterized protein LOC120268441 [Dioscorea cayenensis subsp. rotundata]